MVYSLLVLACTSVTVVSALAVFRITSSRWRRAAGEPAPVAPVTILKPLCGADDSLEANLVTFFTQRHLRYELVFGVEGEDDPAVAVVRRLRARHPDVPCRLVIHDGSRGLNPKVANLQAMLQTGTHDVVVISDSNIAVPDDYVARMLETLSETRVGLVTSLIAGVGEETVGALFDNLQLNGPVAGAVAASQLLGENTVAVGKSMMFRRSDLDRLGGMESVATLLAEDYVIGRMFHDAGFRVRLAPGVVHNVSVHTSFGGFLRRHVRWNFMRSRMKPLVYPLEILLNPMGVGFAAVLFGVTSPWPIYWAVGLTVARDGLQWWRLRGPAGLLLALPLAPLKDVILLGVWGAAPFLRHVSWRGRRYRVSVGTRLYATTPMPIPRAGALRMER